MKNNNFYVYIYEDEKSLPIYVGRGKGKRLYDHLKIVKSRKKPHPFYHKLKKILANGFKPKIYKVKENLSVNQANDLEIKLIKKIGRKDLKKGSLLNLSDGGDGLLNMTQRHRNIIRKRHKGKINSKQTRKKMSLAKKGIKKSTAHRKKLSQVNKGKKQSKETIKKKKNKRWINNGKRSLVINVEELNKYLKEGWIIGRHRFITKATRQQMSNSAKNRKSMSDKTKRKIGKVSKQNRWINNGKINKFINRKKINEFLKMGWKTGRMKIKTKNRHLRRWINNGNINKVVYRKELKKYLFEGWKRGRI